MNFSGHLEALQKRHDKIQDKIRELEMHHLVDEEVNELKRQRLVLKDQIYQLLRKLDELE